MEVWYNGEGYYKREKNRVHKKQYNTNRYVDKRIDMWYNIY